MEFNENELDLIGEAMLTQLADKRKALAESVRLGLGFTSRDFGIPQVEGIIERIEAA